MKELKIADIPEYLRSKYSIDVTRQTVYNWIKSGRNGEKLQVTAHENDASSRFRSTLYAAEADVDDFISRSGLVGQPPVNGSDR